MRFIVVLCCVQAISSVQTSVYRYEGSVNKFLIDDKGSTLIAVFGLPPLAHEDDPRRCCSCLLTTPDSTVSLCRAVLSCLKMRQLMNSMNISCSIGVTSGTV